jgi:methionyl-tRNA formyltransferase
MKNTKPKIVFFGTPEFSVKILEALQKANLTPVLVITAPDKPRGRKLKLSPSPVKEWAQKHNIPAEHNYDNLKSTGADLFIVASFGKILPKEILEIPKYGTLNVHPSLLPKLRGASPIQTAILNGEKETGVTIMLMNEKMDEGDILTNNKLPITTSISFEKLEEKLAELGGELLVETIPKWLAGGIKPQPQDHSQATYSKLIKKSDGEIDWNEPAEIIERKIRAFTPWPSAYTFVNGKRIIITKAKLDEKNALKIERVKPEGKNEMSYEEYLSKNFNKRT